MRPFVPVGVSDADRGLLSRMAAMLDEQLLSEGLGASLGEPLAVCHVDLLDVEIDVGADRRQLRAPAHRFFSSTLDGVGSGLGPFHASGTETRRLLIRRSPNCAGFTVASFKMSATAT